MSKLQSVVQQYRQQLLNQEQHAAQSLEHAYAHTLSQIQPQLDKLYSDIKAKRDAGEDVPVSWIHEQSRLSNLQALCRREISQFGHMAYLTTSELQQFGVQLGQQSALQQLQATVPTGQQYSFGRPSAKAIQDIVGVTQAGSPLMDLFRGYGDEAAQGVTDALTTGLITGSNPRVVANQVQQALGISRSRALVVSRNEMLRAYKSAAMETYRANDDVVGQWSWQASKSARTCAMCLAMDGTLHDLSEDFDSHVQCRCAPVPVTKSWDEILGKYGIDTSNIPDSSAANDGYQSGSDWLDSQSEDVQKSVLGNKYDGYNANTRRYCTH